MRRPVLVPGLAALSVLACQAPFPPPSEVKELRVLATRAEPASGTPGATVSMDLVVADGGGDPNATQPRELELAWFAGCHNPPTRQFFACYPYLQALAAQAPTRLRDVELTALPPGSLGFGDRFELRLPENILSAAPRVPSDPVHFGVSYVFFAVCAGELRTRPELGDRVPLACVDPQTDVELGREDFVTGFATLFSYENGVNENPALESVTFDGAPLVETACTEDTDCESLDGAASFVCGPLGRCARKVAPCARSANPCPPFRVTPGITRSSAETLPTDEGEIVWAKFYATQCRFEHDAQLVNDRKTGWVDGVASNWRARDADCFVRLWVTLHDQRGGADFRSFELFVGE
jgi:hypothetical protein